MLNTKQVRELVKQRFGNYYNSYTNKCKFDNKRNLGFVIKTNLTEAELQALATEVGCASVKQTKSRYYDYGYKQYCDVYNYYLRFVHVDFN